MIPKGRLYVTTKEFGMGLMSARDECAKELLRVYLKYKWNSPSQIGSLIEITQNHRDCILNRMKKTFGKKVPMEWLNSKIQENETKKDMKQVMSLVEKKINEHYLNNWKAKKCAEYARTLENNMVDKKNIK